MDLPKLIVAIGIALVLTSFLNSAVSTLYKPPKIELTKCTTSIYSDNCKNIITQRCGAFPTDPNLRKAYYTCESEAYSSQEYLDCRSSQQSDYQTCVEEEKGKLETYQIVYYLILGIISIIVIIIGFFILTEESIGTGLIGGGVLTVLLAYVYALFAVFTSSLASAMSGFIGLSPELTGAVVSETTSKTPTISYFNIIFLLIALIILIFFAHFKLERRSNISN